MERGNKHNKQAIHFLCSLTFQEGTTNYYVCVPFKMLITSSILILLAIYSSNGLWSCNTTPNPKTDDHKTDSKKEDRHPCEGGNM